MRNLILTFIAASAIAVASVSCSSKGSKSRGGVTGGGVVGALNRALSEVSYSPGGKGYPYKGTNAGPQARSWATKHKSSIESTLSKIPSGYVLQVTGHSDSVGPRTAPGDGRPGNIAISTRRARGVYNALIAAGVPKDKLIYGGVADDMTSSLCGSEDACQRRVSLQVVEKK